MTGVGGRGGGTGIEVLTSFSGARRMTGSAAVKTSVVCGGAWGLAWVLAGTLLNIA